MSETYRFIDFHMFFFEIDKANGWPVSFLIQHHIRMNQDSSSPI